MNRVARQPGLHAGSGPRGTRDRLALSLLVARIGANHIDFTRPANDLAVLANSLDT